MRHPVPPGHSVLGASAHFAAENTEAQRDEVACLGRGWEQAASPSHFEAPAASNAPPPPVPTRRPPPPEPPVASAGGWFHFTQGLLPS